MKLSTIALLPLALMIAGCYSNPFHRASLPPLNHPDPLAAREEFRRSLPEGFTSEDTVLIESPFIHSIAVLAVLRVNRPAGTFDLVGLNQLGVQFFRLSGDPSGSHVDSAVPPLMKHQDVLLSIAADIRRIYFDLIPASTAAVDAGKTEICFHEKTSQGKLVYEFGGSPIYLLDKHLDGIFGAAWRVRYYDYVAGSKGLYPRGIIMDNAHYHYRIIVKNRNWASE